MKQVRTRYAPSPTGYFHIGGARSALFNYLFAKHYNGQFILRIEDTDTLRNVQDGIKSQYDNLLWLNIIPDESLYNPDPKYGSYLQSEKFDYYKQIAHKLVEKHLAYYCFCTPEELKAMHDKSVQEHQTPKYSQHCLHLSQEEIAQNLKQNKPYTIRLIIPSNVNYEWDDIIRGHICIPSEALSDYIILKSNGIASYNFCNVIDDHDMQITHIIRGEEHISNTPYQLATISALKQLEEFKDSAEDFNFIYGHLPIVVNDKGEKLSKRDTSLKQFIQDYKEMGFLASAIDNFLANLGWSCKTNEELFYDLKSIIEEFDGQRISKSPSFFDYNKMLWINKKHIEHLTQEEYLKYAKQFIKIDLKQYDSKLEDLLLLFRKEINYFSQLNDLIQHEFFDEKQFVYNDETTPLMQIAQQNNLFKTAYDTLQQLYNLDELSIKTWLKELSKLTNLKGKNLYMPLRIALFNEEHGPELVKLLQIYGKDVILNKLSIQIK